MIRAMGKHEELADRRRGYKIMAIVAAVVIGPFLLAWGWDSIQKAQWEANSGSHTVKVEGALWGDDFELADTATLVTSAQYEETSIELHISRTSERSTMTPIVVLEIEHGGGRGRCETPRSWMWSTDAGSTVTLLCNLYLELDDIREVDAVSVDLSRN